MFVTCEDAYDFDETSAGLRYICDGTGTVKFAGSWEVILRSM